MQDDQTILNTIVYLKEEESKTWREIGSTVGLSGNAARKRYNRLKRRTQREEEKTEKLGVSVEQRGNVIDFVSKSNRIKTLDELVQECDIDLTEWEIAWHVINKWEVGARGDAGFIVEPLWQVKAKLIRKNPIEVFPFVKPLDIPTTVKLDKPKINNDYKSALILPDAHIGFSTTFGEALIPSHDRRCMKLALDVIAWSDFDVIILNGDTLDLQDFSDFYIRKPSYRNATQAAVIEATIFVSKIRELAPSATIIYMDGNHEERANKMLLKYFTAAYGLRPGDELGLEPLFSVPRMLSLRKNDIEHIGGYPNEEYWLNERILVVHGDTHRTPSGGTAASMIRDIDYSVCFGHAHRQETASRTLHGKDYNRTIYAFSPGCLCRIDGAVPAKKEKQNWQQGMGSIKYTDDELADIQIMTIQNGKTFFDGSIITAEIKEYEEEINERINDGLKELDK